MKLGPALIQVFVVQLLFKMDVISGLSLDLLIVIICRQSFLPSWHQIELLSCLGLFTIYKEITEKKLPKIMKSSSISSQITARDFCLGCTSTADRHMPPFVK